ncbi:hypothetical protein EDC01DRAFT_243438 [Geopyxis carbonaria]|nr:hypothetical protein EDC01DRAFT_243438 [Geopyxis carbonaria]
MLKFWNSCCPCCPCSISARDRPPTPPTPPEPPSPSYWTPIGGHLDGSSEVLGLGIGGGPSNDGGKQPVTQGKTGSRAATLAGPSTAPAQHLPLWHPTPRPPLALSSPLTLSLPPTRVGPLQDPILNAEPVPPLTQLPSVVTDSLDPPLPVPPTPQLAKVQPVPLPINTIPIIPPPPAVTPELDNLLQSLQAEETAKDAAEEGYIGSNESDATGETGATLTAPGALEEVSLGDETAEIGETVEEIEEKAEDLETEETKEPDTTEPKGKGPEFMDTQETKETEAAEMEETKEPEVEETKAETAETAEILEKPEVLDKEEIKETETNTAETSENVDTEALVETTEATEVEPAEKSEDLETADKADDIEGLEEMPELISPESNMPGSFGEE